MVRDELLNDPETAMRLMLDGRQARIWTALPGIVTKVDMAQMTVHVQPTIQGTIELENGNFENVDLPILPNLPIVFPSAGGFTLTLPIAVGDEVLAVFSSRCIDAWWQSGGVQKPMEARMHDLSDGFAIPGPKSQPKKLANISTTAAQLRLDDGSAYIEIDDDGKIKLKTDELTVDGDLKCTGEVTANSETLPVTLSAHVHTGVTTGPGSTGGPVG